jgi:hemerythrin superfamily protein
MDLVSFLKREHAHVRSLLDKLADTSEGAVKTREKLFEQLRLDLEVHATIEEKHLYPRLEQVPSLQAVARDAEAEHQAVRGMLREMQALAVDGEAFMQKVEELARAVEDHVAAEEGEILPRAEDEIGEDELDRIAQRLQDEKQQQMAAAR